MLCEAPATVGSAKSSELTSEVASFAPTVIAVCVSALARSGVATTAVKLEHIGVGLRSYCSTHGEYPPDLTALVATGTLPPNPLARDSGDAISGVTYVTGLKPTDPPHWIVAYAHTSFVGFPLVGVLYNDNSDAMLPTPEFERVWGTCKQEYEADRGTPPTVLEPADASQQ